MKSKPILPTPRWKLENGYEQLDDKERAKLIEEAMFLVWDSLHSHLPHTYCKGKDEGGAAFQKRCVQEYATLIQILSRLY